MDGWMDTVYTAYITAKHEYKLIISKKQKCIKSENENICIYSDIAQEVYLLRCDFISDTVSLRMWGRRVVVH